MDWGDSLVSKVPFLKRENLSEFCPQHPREKAKHSDAHLRSWPGKAETGGVPGEVLRIHQAS